jgi:hypothetical protein
MPRQPKKDLIAQWAFDTRPILGRFHLWLEDIEIHWVRGEQEIEFVKDISFMDGRMERLFAITGAVTALGTQLFGRYGDARKEIQARIPKDDQKRHLNQIKKDADAISAYAMSECLWYASRNLPENHAILVSLGEGLMPKGGETPEMGSNPQLGFGRVYARPEVARWLDTKVAKMLNDRQYGWKEFYQEVRHREITVWGAAIDTLENTSRFATGEATGPLTVLHVFDQPLAISQPYEGYVGTLFLPKRVADAAAEQSVLLNFLTPRDLVMRAIERAYPKLKRSNVHVWTLRGKSRGPRLESLWKSWEELGAHLVGEGWKLPSGMAAFTDSGTYAPTYRVGAWEDDTGDQHLFIVDGYAASAEAMQAASLAPMMGLEASLCIFTSRFELPIEREQLVMSLDPFASDFLERLEERLGRTVDIPTLDSYGRMIRAAFEAGLPQKPVITVDDFFPEKHWDVLAVTGQMRPCPYTGMRGVEEIFPGTYRVTSRLASPKGEKVITFTLRLMESVENSRQVFKPLLNRFLAGEDFENRAVRISDSGRIRNELQTLASEALEYLAGNRIRVVFDRIPVEVVSLQEQVRLREILRWYKTHHPIWFAWLDLG